jgi:3-hydroxyisobutyrate dehydrogenase-like beta-hydroxyacid dehydrogenase
MSEGETAAMAVGFVGLGNIGGPMATRLIGSGVTLTVNDLSQSAVARMVEKGAVAAKSLRDLARSCSVIFLSLPGPPEVEKVVAGPDGILASARRGTIVVDLTTNAVDTVRRMRDLASQKGIEFLDAPVSGGVIGARKGTLAVMIGGSAAAIDKITPYVKSFGENIFHVGDVGAGTVAKLVNNQIVMAASIVVQEALTMAKKAGIKESVIVDILNKSSAKAYAGMIPLFLAREFDKVAFKLSLASKDVDVALLSAKSLGVDMPTTAAASVVYHKALAAGLGEKAFYATLSMIENA